MDYDPRWLCGKFIDISGETTMTMRNKLWAVGAAFIGCILISSPGSAQNAASVEPSKPKLTTNQSLIEDLMRGEARKFQSAREAFGFVFASLPDKVFVYPTENYYYYTVSIGGVTYAGNLRLAAQDRDRGVLHFASFRQANQAADAGPMMYRALSAADGVRVEKLNTFTYRVTYETKSVVFQLNDVSNVTPPATIMADGETYLGNVFDESGIEFYLFYNKRLRVFAYVLNERSAKRDAFVAIEKDGRIAIGKRTGFALYTHHHLDRRVLIGVHGLNTVVNNYFDGPADQLPENHIKNDNLRRAIEAADPTLKDQLDPFGYFLSGEGRYLIAPYIQYYDTADLKPYDDCASAADLPKSQYDGCFISTD
ncbi:MAG: hypothetical protein AAFR23_02025 [Pseudomonadota bacterium]